MARTILVWLRLSRALTIYGSSTQNTTTSQQSTNDSTMFHLSQILITFLSSSRNLLSLYLVTTTALQRHTANIKSGPFLSCHLAFCRVTPSGFFFLFLYIELCREPLGAHRNLRLLLLLKIGFVLGKKELLWNGKWIHCFLLLSYISHNQLFLRAAEHNGLLLGTNNYSSEPLWTDTMENFKKGWNKP